MAIVGTFPLPSADELNHTVLWLHIPHKIYLAAFVCQRSTSLRLVAKQVFSGVFFGDPTVCTIPNRACMVYTSPLLKRTGVGCKYHVWVYAWYLVRAVSFLHRTHLRLNLFELSSRCEATAAVQPPHCFGAESCQESSIHYCAIQCRQPRWTIWSLGLQLC